MNVHGHVHEAHRNVAKDSEFANDLEHGHGHGPKHTHAHKHRNEHGHGHSHGSSCHSIGGSAPQHPRRSARKAMCRLVAALIFCLIFLACETVGGIISHSIAVLSDAVHLLGDVASFAVSIFAIRLGSGSASQRFTFGLARAEVLGALASTLITLALTIVLVYEAVVRLWVICKYEISLLASNHTNNATASRDFEPVDGMVMTIIAAIGILVNVILLLILTGSGHQHSHGGLPASHGHDHGHGHGKCSGTKSAKVKRVTRTANLETPLMEPVSADEEIDNPQGSEDLNVRAACIHALGDLLQSIAVLLAGSVIWVGQHFHWTGWIQICDPVCTLIFALFVVITTIPIFKSITIVLMEGTPPNLDALVIYTEMKEELSQHGGVEDIHDLHIWTLNGSETCLSAHIITAPPEEGGDMKLALSKTRELLREQFGITHSTIQVEERGNSAHGTGCMDHQWQIK